MMLTDTTRTKPFLIDKRQVYEAYKAVKSLRILSASIFAGRPLPKNLVEVK
jgi:hypothetical protein